MPMPLAAGSEHEDQESAPPPAALPPLLLPPPVLHVALQVGTVSAGLRLLAYLLLFPLPVWCCNCCSRTCNSLVVSIPARRESMMARIPLSRVSLFTRCGGACGASACRICSWRSRCSFEGAHARLPSPLFKKLDRWESDLCRTFTWFSCFWRFASWISTFLRQDPQV
jgi:hypothetical protein